MKTVLIFLSFVAAAHTQATGCPGEWVSYGDNCYKFVSYPRLSTEEASVACQKDSAALVSVNTLQEHAFIMNHLQTTDGSRDTWLTSGLVTRLPDGVSWLGDGTQSMDVGSNWLTDTQTNNRKQGDSVVYRFSGVLYGWSVGDLSTLSSFICKIALINVDKIVDEKRGFDYGLPIDNPELAPRGPSFLAEPVETTILSQTSTVFLDCLADGNPKPEYSWLKGQIEGGIMTPLAMGNRHSMTGGRLAIQDPVNADDGWYQCNATNQFGTILSRPAALSFGSLGEFSNVPSSDVYGQVSQGAVIECPKITAKPAVAYQWHKQKSSSSPLVFIRPEMQNHMFISNGGKLYFSELASSDDDTYYCSVTLTSIGGTGSYVGSNSAVVRTSLGFRLHVTSGVSMEYHPVIQDDFIKAYPGSPKRGQTIELECFAYGTAPLTYRWIRVGKEMPRNSSLSNSNRVLTIQNVQIEDGGLYRCRVDSSKTSRFSEKNFTLDIQSEPYFSYPLTNQHVDVGSRLSWHCEARGKPAPTYTWYKNGRLLENSTGVTITGNTMVIDSVQKDRDNGLYQCGARNLYGTSYSSAQIRVLEFAPTFAKRPVDSSLSAAVGGNITIICSPEASPAPQYVWLRNGADLGLTKGGPANNGFQMLANGNLFITNINNGHQGEYTCKVTNTIGTAQSSGTLRVFPSIVISEKPRNVQEMVNETVAMVCTASAPPNVDVIYIWRFNGYLIDFKRHVEFRMGTGATAGTLFIVGVQFKHEGWYMCEVNTGMDSQTASALLTVKGPPGEPSGVFQGDNQGSDSTAVNPGERFVRIYWSDGLIRGSPIIAYTVEFRTNFDQTWRVHPNAKQVDARLVQSAEFPDKRTILLINLKPNAGHEFRVRAINQFGIGDPSLPSIIIQVDGSPPIVAPYGLTGGGGKVGDLTIRWEPLPKEDYNGNNLRYNIFWREKPTNPQIDSKWDSAKDLLPEERCRQVADLRKGLLWECSYTALVGDEKYYMPYEVRIQAKNVHGDGVISEIVDIMSAEEMPSATPRNVFSSTWNSSALQVFWQPVSNTRASVRGKLIGYRINYWEKDVEKEEQARYNIITIPPGEDNIDNGIIIGLQGLHWYYSNVQVITSAGYGPKSEDYPQEVGNYAAKNYPTEVHVYSIEGLGLRVNFRGISTRTMEAPVRGYMLQYWPSGENIRKAQIVDVGRSDHGYITNVTESVLYELRVYGYSDIGGQGARSSPSVLFTVGNGQVRFNPETTEVMAGCSLLQSSVVTVLCALLLPLLLLLRK